MMSPYKFPALYAAQHKNQLEDLEFYQGFCGASVLELGCGTGRLSFPLAAAGHQLTGVDIDENMLAYANEILASRKELADRIRFIRSDIRVLDLGEKFDTVIFPYNSIGHISPGKDLEQLAAAIASHMNSDGKCIVSLLQPDDDLCSADSELRHLEQFSDAAGVIIDLYERTQWFPENNRLVFDWYYEQDAQDELLHLRNELHLHSGEGLARVFAAQGLVLKKCFGDFDGAPWREGSPELLQLYQLA
ncbi:class I SAM-dependent methyltransferase [Spirochaeta dissipatitropha]